MPLFVPENGNDVAVCALLLAGAWQGRDRLVAVRHGRDRLFQFPARREAARRRDARVRSRPSSRLLAPIARDWAKLAFEHPTAGFAKPQDGSDQSAVLGRWKITAMYGLWQFGERDWTWIDMPPNPRRLPVGGAAMIQLGPDEFLVAGSDLRMRFALDKPAARRKLAVPRRRGRHVREWPLGDGAPLEWRPDRLRT